MRDAILVINTGSSSIKFAVYSQAENQLPLHQLSGQVKDIGGQACFAITRVTEGQASPAKLTSIKATDHAGALHYILTWLASNVDGLNLIAAGHRVVHGGHKYTSAIRIDAQVLDELRSLIALAPLHQPHALHAIESLQAQQPHLLHVACFDTAFHADMPWYEQRFALPQQLQQQGIRRYGFHGLSYEYIASVLPEHLGERANGKVVIAHLGHGVSMCALQQGRSMATTMSFTPLDGLPMGRRSGTIDPAIVLYLLRTGMQADAISDLLHHQSGLLGLSGISDDMQTLLASSQAPAREAVSYFCYRISRELGSLAAVLQGLDALVFTGGIGEHAAPVRAGICDNAGWLGVTLDASANAADATDISGQDSRVAVRVIPTDEEYIIAQHTFATMAKS
ncbi:MAG: acetate/propionate family kinase [Gammaproteobacteria bacterium]